MALRLSGKQLKNLTTRLREGKETPDDLHALADVLLYYQQVLADADIVSTRELAIERFTWKSGEKASSSRSRSGPDFSIGGRNCSSEWPTN